ncbi:hypothetical protein LK09_17065 [Microbacterium mangrovi]|uniref:Uncharacterized protein n=1 Tax=Microbacterium mangrovi TaxID=1348253 RepID=A0A0B1ZXV1_9MICO|nr:hypothetical protein [Microbacterium mangrovi]KHK96055.1 hypothetical protein LK09_17065 [Microbacterium mangrovi]
MSDSREHDADGAPADEELQEPSTEKEPEEEPRKPHPDEPEPSHRAVGLGVDYHEPEEPEADGS